MKNTKKKNGISLIVLVITIIVMIILAGSIILSLSNSGIIGKANKAKNDTDISAMREMAGVAAAEYELEVLRGTTTKTKKEYVESYLTTQGLILPEGYEVTEEGEIAEASVVDNLKEIKAGEYAKETSKYIDSNNDVAVIPMGFTVSNLSDEMVIQDGLVIYEGDLSSVDNIADYKGTNNQFVWIPVEDPNSMYGIANVENVSDWVCNSKQLYYGKLYEYNSNGTISHFNWYDELTDEYVKKYVMDENDFNSWDEFVQGMEEIYNSVYSDAKSEWDKMSEEEKMELEKVGVTTAETYVKKFVYDLTGMSNNLEDVRYSIYAQNYHDNTDDIYFSKMVNSVEKYNGFYIGRYETSGTYYDLKTVSNYTNYVRFMNYREYENIGGVIGKIWDCQFDQALLFTNKKDIGEKEKNIYNLANKYDEETNAIRTLHSLDDHRKGLVRIGWTRVPKDTSDAIEANSRLQLYIK